MNSAKYVSGRDAGSKGVSFQISLLTMFLLNALQKISNWSLSTENPRAGKFDDVVLEWPEGAILLQAKHKENKKITLEAIFSTNSRNDDFSLAKYFISYQKIKNNFKVKHVVICTNSDVDDKILKFLDVENICYESMLHCPDHDYSYFKFNTHILPHLKETVIKYMEKNCRNEKIDQAILTEENLRDFLEHLQLHAGFPSLDDLKKIIEQLLSVIKYNNDLYDKTSCLEIQAKVMDWFQRKQRMFLTESYAKAMFCEIRTGKYWQKLEQYKVSFYNNDLQFQDSKKVHYIIADDRYLLQEIKIYRTLQNNKGNILCVNPYDDVEVQKQVLEAFQLPQYVFLVIIRPGDTIMTEINDTFGTTLQRYQYKKVIIVVQSSDELIHLYGLDQKDHEVIFGSVTLDDLSEETREMLLNKVNIVFQGQDFSLGELFPVRRGEDFEKAANIFLIPLIGDEKVTVGVPLFDLDDNVTRLYVDRTFKWEVNEMETRVYSEESIYDVNEKIIIIADTAGMGKTTVLTNLALIIKEKHPLLWVIKIHLNDFTAILRDYKKINRQTISILELLNSKDATRLTSDIENCVFTLRNKVVLLLDGVDEISPDYTNLAISLLLDCKDASNFAKVFVTTRPHMAWELETQLQAVSFTLQPFTEENQIRFLTRYWTHHLHLRRDLDKCEKYAKALLHKMSLTDLNNGIEDHFAAIPLQLKMLAEIFQESMESDESLDWQGCKEYLHSDEEEPLLPEKMDLVKLYDMYIDKKRDIFIDRENPNGHTAATRALICQFDECLDLHRTLALEIVLEERGRELFSCYKNISKDMETVALKIGIVQKPSDEFTSVCNYEYNVIDMKNFSFIHRTLAEYFVAESIAKELQCGNENVKFQKFLIDEVFCTDTFNVVLTFFDNSLHKILDLLPATIFQNYQSLSYEVRLIWKYNLDLIHQLAERGYVAILRLLLKCTNFTIIRDKEVLITDIYNVDVRSNIEKRNTLNCLQFFLEQGGLNIKDYLGRTPLHFAASKGHLKMVRFLVEQGANTNSKSEWCGTPIVEAIQNGHVDVTKYLLDQSLGFERTAVVEDDSVSNFDMEGFLLENILRSNGSGVENTMIPYVAACMGCSCVLETLIEHGINLDSKFENGETLIFGAARGGRLQIIEHLVKRGADVNCKDDRGRTVLHLISRKPWGAPTAELLIQLGIDVNISDIFGQTALHVAAFRGILNMVQLLVENGADINSSDEFGRTALNAAASWGNLNCVKFLVEKGADVNVRDKDGNTVIHLAASRGRVRIVKYFVACGVDINIRNNGGQTALHAAATVANEDTIQFLMDLGLDVNTKDDRGRTVLHIAVEKFLANVEHTIDVDLPAIHEERRYSEFQSVLSSFKYLIDQDVDVNIKDKDGRTVLHLAAEKGQLDTVKFLLDIGAEVNAKDKMGRTPLHLAAKEGHGAVQLLVEQGAAVTSRDCKGNTPAALAKKAGHSYLLQYLKEKNERSRCIQIMSAGCLK